jgi:glucose-1-phosphate thymidylyltransferase
MVSKAILFPPRAARGSNFGLLPIANRPLVLHALDALAGAGLRQVLIVCSPEEVMELRALMAERPRDGVEPSLLVEVEPSNLATSLTAAQAFLADEPFVVHLGDSLSREPLWPKVQGRILEQGDALALVQGRDATSSSVVALRPDPLGGDEPAGLYVLGSGLIDAARAAPRLPGIEESLLAALAELTARGGRVETVTVESWWRHRGHPSALLEANRFLLEGLRAGPTDAALVDTDIQGSVAIDPTARLESTVVRGPAVIGPRARLLNAYVGPYTSIGPDVHIEGAEIEHSIILPGASISHLGGRLEASIVGARARVFRDFRLPRALRLNVGEDAEVSLA